MSEHINEQLSEFIDDEMSAEACEFFVRRLERDDAARACYRRYQLIGAAVRGDHLAFNAAAAAARRDRAAASSADAISSRPPARRRVAVGVGLAASLALVAVFAFQMTSLDRDEEIAQAGAYPESDVMGMQYLMHHTAFSNGLGRPFMNSSLISGPQFDFDEDADVDDND